MQEFREGKSVLLGSDGTGRDTWNDDCYLSETEVEMDQRMKSFLDTYRATAIAIKQSTGEDRTSLSEGCQVQADQIDSANLGCGSL
jgi:hypothetical protein